MTGGSAGDIIDRPRSAGLLLAAGILKSVGLALLVLATGVLVLALLVPPRLAFMVEHMGIRATTGEVLAIAAGLALFGSGTYAIGLAAASTARVEHVIANVESHLGDYSHATREGERATLAGRIAERAREAALDEAVRARGAAEHAEAERRRAGVERALAEAERARAEGERRRAQQVAARAESERIRAEEARIQAERVRALVEEARERVARSEDEAPTDEREG